jgi:hypothetical protein
VTDEHDHDDDHHEPVDGEHDHDEELSDQHDHDHDHEHDDLDEEEAERRLLTLVAALANLSDADIQRAVGEMREQSRNELADQLQLTKATMHLGDALPALLRRKVLSASPERQLATAFALSEGVNDHAIAALGDRHDDPSRADLDEVLPDLIDRDGLPLVALMAAAYACSDARCQRVMGELLDTDERFELPEPPSVDEVSAVEVHQVTTFRRDTDDPAQVAKREQRKAAKAAKREAEVRRKDAAAAAQSARKQAQHRANQTKTHK